MKKIYTILVSLAAIFMATDADAQLSVGLGYNHGTNVSKINKEKDSDNLNGFYLEALYEWNFLSAGWGDLGLEPGVRFTYLGDADSEEEFGYTLKSGLNEAYIDVPVNVKYSYDLGSVRLSAFVGPDFSFGLSSVSKVSLSGDGVDYVVKYHNYSGKTVTKGDGSSSASKPDGYTDYGRFDVKLGLGIGATFMDKLNVKLGYNIGLLNRYTGEQLENYKAKMHTNVFYVGLGFNF